MATQPRPEVNVQQAVPFFMITSMEASLRFYVEGLGFVMTKKWTPENEHKIEWCALKVGEAALMLQEYRKDHHPNSGRPDGKLGVGVSICFVCRDALDIYREARARGVTAKTPFVGNGMWVTSFEDPDGYRIDFESYTDAPEETVFSEDESRPSS
jgi:lactoylglutathione lyase